MSENKEFLGTEPVGKLLLKLAVPSVISQLVNMLYNIVDRIYIGHIPKTGSLALTGLGVCMPIIMIISAFAALIGFGGAPRASIFMGKGENDSAEKTLGNCFTTQIIISIILTIVLLFGNRFFLMAFGASDNTIDFATSYMNIYALGTIFVQLTLGMNSFVTAQGFSKTGMLTVVIGAVCNIILDPIFIFVLGLGVKGAAIATIISQGVSCIWVISFLTGRKTFLKIKKKYLMPSADVILPCMALGVSTFVMQASESVISVCFNSSLLKYGGCRGSNDNTYKRYAVRYASITGYRSGSTACHQLQLRCKKHRPCQKDIQNPNHCITQLFCCFLGIDTNVSKCICRHIQFR